MRLALTDKAILALHFTASGQQIVRDAELPGFFVMVGKRTKTFMVQGDLRQTIAAAQGRRSGRSQNARSARQGQGVVGIDRKRSRPSAEGGGEGGGSQFVDQPAGRVP